jgi:hypothetical protein
MAEETIHNANGDDVTKYVARLKALLATATSQAGTPEGDLAQAKAFEFMHKYGIDASMLTDEVQAEEKRVCRTIEIHSIYASQLQFLAGNIADAVVGTHPLIAGKGNRRYVYVYGYDTAALTVQMLYATLSMQVLSDVSSGRAWQAALRDDPRLRGYSDMDRFVWRRSYIESFAIIIWRRLCDTRQATVDASGSGAELAVVDREQRIKDWASEFVSGKKAKPSRETRMDYAGLNAGAEAGRRADLGDGSSTLGGSKRPALT